MPNIKIEVQKVSPEDAWVMYNQIELTTYTPEMRQRRLVPDVKKIFDMEGWKDESYEIALKNAAGEYGYRSPQYNDVMKRYQFFTSRRAAAMIHSKGEFWDFFRLDMDTVVVIHLTYDENIYTSFTYGESAAKPLFEAFQANLRQIEITLDAPGFFSDATVEQMWAFLEARPAAKPTPRTLEETSLICAFYAVSEDAFSYLRGRVVKEGMKY